MFLVVLDLTVCVCHFFFNKIYNGLMNFTNIKDFTDVVHNKTDMHLKMPNGSVVGRLNIKPIDTLRGRRSEYTFADECTFQGRLLDIKI